MKKKESVRNRKKQLRAGMSGQDHLSSFTVSPPSFDEYSHKPEIYLEVAKNYGNNQFTNLLITDDLITHFAKMFTEDEASVVRHLGYYPKGKTADTVAKAEHRPVKEVQKILDNLVHDRNLLISYGPSRKKRYAI